MWGSNTLICDSRVLRSELRPKGRRELLQTLVDRATVMSSIMSQGGSACCGNCYSLRGSASVDFCVAESPFLCFGLLQIPIVFARTLLITIGPAIIAVTGIQEHSGVAHSVAMKFSRLTPLLAVLLYSWALKTRSMLSLEFLQVKYF